MSETCTIDPAVVRVQDAARRDGVAPPDPLGQSLSAARVTAERYHSYLNGDLPPIAGVDTVAVDGPAGPVPVRLFRPNDRDDLPVLVYFHGGGFVLNSLETHDRLMRLLALRSGAVVCGVGYSRAPEHRFPHQLKEAQAVLRWLFASARAYAIDPTRVAVGGDSAGANLALSVLIDARTRGWPNLIFGVLFYGMYAPDFDTGSHLRFGDGRYGLSTARMRWYWHQYLGTTPAAANHPLAAPLAADLTGLPPLLLIGAGCDCLLDDTLSLNDRLRRAGVPCCLSIARALPHSFAVLTRLVPSADQTVSATAETIRDHLFNR